MQIKGKKVIKNSLEFSKNIPTGYHIEADKTSGGISVCVSGVLSIPELNDKNVQLKVRRGKITIKGEELSVSIYENKIVEISGKVGGIEFYDKD